MEKDSNIEIVIESGKSTGQYWRDIWHYRELFYFLAWRDLIVRYKQTIIGIIWVLLKPFITMLIFTVIFQRLANLSSGGVPYSLMVLSALLPWFFFATAVADLSGSIIGNANIISKIYFPRVIMVGNKIIVNLVDFLITLILLACLMAYFKFLPDYRVLFMPLFVLEVIILTLGLGLFFAALNVKYRDVGYIIPFMIQIGFYASPIGYSSSIIPEKYKLIYYLNPIAGIVDGFRWSILRGQTPLYTTGLIISVSFCIFCLLFGIYYFRKTERNFADVI